MDLRKYNADKELEPRGFINLGFTCYYNSLLQSLLSCTSLVEEFLNNQNYYQNHDNLMCRLLEKLIRESHDNPENVEEIGKLSPITWKGMINTLAKESPEIAKFAMGQQCTVEGFNLLLQTLEKEQDIQNLFLHRRCNKLYCSKCNKWCSNVDEMSTLFEIEPEFKLQQLDQFKNLDKHYGKKRDLNTFLLNQNSYVDENHICTLCEHRGTKFRHSQLVMIPEILFVMSKKYKYSQSTGGIKLNTYTDFPKVLEFKGKSDLSLRYEAIAQIEHSGGLNGGHYWAICKRKNGWFCLNDMSVSPAEFKPTNNIYVVLYHIV